MTSLQAGVTACAFSYLFIDKNNQTAYRTTQTAFYHKVVGRHHNFLQTKAKLKLSIQLYNSNFFLVPPNPTKILITLKLNLRSHILNKIK